MYAPTASAVDTATLALNWTAPPTALLRGIALFYNLFEIVNYASTAASSPSSSSFRYQVAVGTIIITHIQCNVDRRAGAQKLFFGLSMFWGSFEPMTFK